MAKVPVGKINVPRIGANGNWFIGDNDTGVSATKNSSDIFVEDDVAYDLEFDKTYIVWMDGNPWIPYVQVNINENKSVVRHFTDNGNADGEIIRHNGYVTVYVQRPFYGENPSAVHVNINIGGSLKGYYFYIDPDSISDCSFSIGNVTRVSEVSQVYTTVSEFARSVAGYGESLWYDSDGNQHTSLKRNCFYCCSGHISLLGTKRFPVWFNFYVPRGWDGSQFNVKVEVCQPNYGSGDNITGWTHSSFYVRIQDYQIMGAYLRSEENGDLVQSDGFKLSLDNCVGMLFA